LGVALVAGNYIMAATAGGTLQHWLLRNRGTTLFTGEGQTQKRGVQLVSSFIF
jgi:hypothetical protein